MTAWNEMTLGDFDRKRAPKSALEAADAGQDALFPGTPTLPAKPAKPRQELDGQAGLFGTGTEDVSGAWDGFQVISDADPGL